MSRSPKRSAAPYRSRPARTHAVTLGDGKQLPVASGYEQKVIQDLVARRARFWYEPDTLEIRLPLRGGNCTKCGATGKDLWKSGVYTVDLRLEDPFQGMRYVELKGRLTSFERTRLRALHAAYGDKFKLYLLLQRDNTINKGSKTRCREWAESVGFTVAVGNRIPEEWIA